MTAKRFYDTNILIYAFDSSNTVKQQVALNSIAEATATGQAVISTQVLGEFFHATVTRKKLLTATEAERAIQSLRAAFQVESIEQQLVQHAITIHQQFQLRYWDALIVATANHANCSELLSEDLSHDQQFLKTRIVNPFIGP